MNAEANAMAERYAAEAYYSTRLCQRCNRTFAMIDAFAQRYTGADGNEHRIIRCPKCGAMLDEEIARPDGTVIIPVTIPTANENESREETIE